MKKIILLFLAILPIVLLVVIAFAGQILSLYNHIPVESVQFVDRMNNPYTNEYVFAINQKSTKATRIMIYPELATNKNVKYSSSDEKICTVDENGVIAGLHYGTATVMVKTDDGGKIATLNVVVKADVPYDVTLSEEKLDMTVGGIHQLTAVVDAPVAVIKDVTYESSDPSVVEVDATGKLTAKAPGTAIVTVVTVSGELTDTCEVTVTEGELPIYFDFSGNDAVRFINGYYVLSTDSLNMREYLRTSAEIAPEDVTISLYSGSAASLSGDVLTFTKTNGIVTLRVYATEGDKTVGLIEISVIYSP